RLDGQMTGFWHPSTVVGMFLSSRRMLRLNRSVSMHASWTLREDRLASLRVQPASLRAGHLLLLAQEKATKEKGAPALPPTGAEGEDQAHRAAHAARVRVARARPEAAPGVRRSDGGRAPGALRLPGLHGLGLGAQDALSAVPGRGLRTRRAGCPESREATRPQGCGRNTHGCESVV